MHIYAEHAEHSFIIRADKKGDVVVLQILGATSISYCGALAGLSLFAYQVMTLLFMFVLSREWINAITLHSHQPSTPGPSHLGEGISNPLGPGPRLRWTAYGRRGRASMTGPCTVSQGFWISQCAEQLNRRQLAKVRTARR